MFLCISFIVLVSNELDTSSFMSTVKPGLRWFCSYLRGGLLCTALSVRLSDKDKVNFEEISCTKIVGRDL